jgi:hypothetical protein
MNRYSWFLFVCDTPRRIRFALLLLPINHGSVVLCFLAVHTINVSGLSMETLYRLMSFGMKVEEIPITSSGAIKTKNHLQWIKTRKAIDERRRVMAIRERRWEERRRQQLQEQHQHQHHPATGDDGGSGMESDSTTSTSLTTTATGSIDNHGGNIIVHPGVHDVLIAKGGKSNHWGNIDFQSLMGICLEEYNNLPKRSIRRKEIRTELIQAVYACKGRFLEMDDEIVRNINNNTATTTDTNSSSSSTTITNTNCTIVGSINSNSNNNPSTTVNKKKTVSRDWWREITDQVELDTRIKTVIYDYSRRLEAKRNIQRNKSCTTKFSALDGMNINNIKRRRLISDHGDDDHHNDGTSSNDVGWWGHPPMCSR